MDYNDKAFCVIIATIVFVFGIIIGFKAGENRATATIRNKAIEANAAKWTIDEKTGEKEFVFISTNQEK